MLSQLASAGTRGELFSDGNHWFFEKIFFFLLVMMIPIQETAAAALKRESEDKIAALSLRHTQVFFSTKKAQLSLSMWVTRADQFDCMCASADACCLL